MLLRVHHLPSAPAGVWIILPRVRLLVKLSKSVFLPGFTTELVFSAGL